MCSPHPGPHRPSPEGDLRRDSRPSLPSGTYWGRFTILLTVYALLFLLLFVWGHVQVKNALYFFFAATFVIVGRWETLNWGRLEREHVVRRRRMRGIVRWPLRRTGPPSTPGRAVQARANVRRGKRRAAIGAGLSVIGWVCLMIGVASVIASQGNRLGWNPGHVMFLMASTLVVLAVIRERRRWRRMETERVEGRRRARLPVLWPRRRRVVRAATEAPSRIVRAPVEERPPRFAKDRYGPFALALIVAGCLATVWVVFASFLNR